MENNSQKKTIKGVKFVMFGKYPKGGMIWVDKTKEKKKLYAIIITVLSIAIGFGVFFVVRNQTGRDGEQLQTVNLKTTYLTVKYPKKV